MLTVPAYAAQAQELMSTNQTLLMRTVPVYDALARELLLTTPALTIPDSIERVLERRSTTRVQLTAHDCAALVREHL